MAATVVGTVCTYGVAGTVTNLFVQSYSLKSSFISEDTVTNESGLTSTWRGDDRMSELSVEGIVKTGNPPVLGANISFTLSTTSSVGTGTASSSFTGVITAVEEKGGTKEFVKYSITAKDWEGIAIT
jgi:hypothetical protein